MQTTKTILSRNGCTITGSTPTKLDYIDRNGQPCSQEIVAKHFD